MNDNHISNDIIGKAQIGKIKVATEILNTLSSGIYSSPASCLKELVNNAYDAEAKMVTIRIKPIQDSVIVIDNGSGMNAEEFDHNFAWISKSNKRIHGNISPNLRRPLIGKIGIGFIAVNEICDVLEITSTKEGEATKFTAIINFKEYFSKSIREGDDIIKGEYSLLNEPEEPGTHYTSIRLLGLKKTVRDILEGKQHVYKNQSNTKDYFSSMQELMEYHDQQKLRSFTDDNPYIQFILDLASYIPVEYLSGGPIEGINDTIIRNLVKEKSALDFKVDLDGIYLKSPIFFKTASKEKKDKTFSYDYKSFSEVLNVDSEKIIFRGYFFVQNKILFPRELNGISLKIKGVPIAERFGFDTSMMQYPNYRNNIFRNWISGEIYIEKGLEEAMNVDRKSFRVTHPQYLALQNFIHKYLDEVIFQLAFHLYQEGNKQRKLEEKNGQEKAKKILFGVNKIEYKPSMKQPIPKSNTTSSDTKMTESTILPITIETTDKGIEIDIDPLLEKLYKKKDWEILENVFLIFEKSLQESQGDTIKLRKLFYENIRQWKGLF